MLIKPVILTRSPSSPPVFTKLLYTSLGIHTIIYVASNLSFVDLIAADLILLYPA